jgi:hypothetical protein
MITVFDFFTFFLGLGLTTLGEFFALAGGANSNFGLAVFSVMLIIIGIGISTIRELTSENAEDEEGIRKIYGFVCFVAGVAFVIIPVVRAAFQLLNGNMDLGSALLLIFSVVVGVIYIFLGYSWAGAFDPPPDADF